LGGLNAWAEIDPSVSGEYNVALTPMGPLTKDEIVRTYVWHNSGYDDMEVEGSIALNRIA
jgi:hypothetical protein